MGSGAGAAAVLNFGARAQDDGVVMNFRQNKFTTRGVRFSASYIPPPGLAVPAA